MNDILFTQLISAFMSLDPWPYGPNEGLIEWMNDEAKKRGYEDWIQALHGLKVIEVDPFEWLVDKGYRSNG